MTPKEKAKELRLKYYVNIPLNCLMLDENLAKKCALIAVDELFDYNSKESMHNYWILVKEEIEKL